MNSPKPPFACDFISISPRDQPSDVLVMKSHEKINSLSHHAENQRVTKTGNIKTCLNGEYIKTQSA